MKEEYIKIANQTFRDYNIEIKTDEHRHLQSMTKIIETHYIFIKKSTKRH